MTTRLTEDDEALSGFERRSRKCQNPSGCRFDFSDAANIDRFRHSSDRLTVYL